MLSQSNLLRVGPIAKRTLEGRPIASMTAPSSVTSRPCRLESTRPDSSYSQYALLSSFSIVILYFNVTIGINEPEDPSRIQNQPPAFPQLLYQSTNFRGDTMAVDFPKTSPMAEESSSFDQVHAFPELRRRGPETVDHRLPADILACCDLHLLANFAYERSDFRRQLVGPLFWPIPLSSIHVGSSPRLERI